MPSSWYLMNNKYHSGVESSEFQDYSGGFDELLVISPESRDGLLDGSIPLRVIVQQKTKSNKKKVLAKIGSLSTGSYLSCDSGTWLIDTFINNNAMYEFAEMQLCNNSLKWVDASGLTQEFLCVVDQNTNQKIIEDDRGNVNLPRGFSRILIPYNDITRTIQLRQRFIINGDAFEVQGIDKISKVKDGRGIIDLTINTTPVKADDNLVENIADNDAVIKNPSKGVWAGAKTGKVV